MAGQEGQEGVLWRFQPPRQRIGWASGGGCYGRDEVSPATADGWGSGEKAGDRGGDKSSRKKKGAAKVPAKKQTRYPKRATR